MTETPSGSETLLPDEEGTGSGLRTFLMAGVRGYTRVTQEPPVSHPGFGGASVGSQQASAIYMRARDLVRAHLASPGRLDIEFENAFHIEIQPGP